jgi:hypothetical protein
MKCAINLMGFQRFDSGTKGKLLGERKFVILGDDILILFLAWQIRFKR